MSLSSIVIVVDPTQTRHPALERGIVSARETGAQLHLITPVFQNADPAGRVDPELGRQGIIHEYERQLFRLADHSDSKNLEISCEAIWDEQPVRAIIEAAARHGADMVFKEASDIQVSGRRFGQRDDWELLRNSPCPVLMVKGKNAWQSRKILASVNVLSHDREHQRLNHQIANFAQRFAQSHGAEVHVANAYNDSLHYPDRTQLSRLTGADNERIHIRNGDPDAVIGELAKELAVDLVLIGTVGRKGLTGLVIGNTAERVLANVDCDVMVVN